MDMNQIEERAMGILDGAYNGGKGNGAILDNSQVVIGRNHNPREAARDKAALELLIEKGLIEETGTGTYKLIEAGWQEAEKRAGVNQS